MIDGVTFDSEQSIYGYSPLYQALKNGNESNAMTLVRKGSDITVKTKLDWTVLHLIASTNKVTFLNYLFQTCESAITPEFLSAKTLCGRTALEIAVEHGHKEVAMQVLSLMSKDKQAEELKSILEKGLAVQLHSMITTTLNSLSAIAFSCTPKNDDPQLAILTQRYPYIDKSQFLQLYTDYQVLESQKSQNLDAMDIDSDSEDEQEFEYNAHGELILRRTQGRPKYIDR